MLQHGDDRIKFIICGNYKKSNILAKVLGIRKDEDSLKVHACLVSTILYPIISLSETWMVEVYPNLLLRIERRVRKTRSFQRMGQEI